MWVDFGYGCYFGCCVGDEVFVEVWEFVWYDLVFGNFEVVVFGEVDYCVVGDVVEEVIGYWCVNDVVVDEEYVGICVFCYLILLVEY